MTWISVKEKLPNPGERVIVVLDYSLWDPFRGRKTEFATVHFASEKQPFGGPNSLTGSGFLLGIYFAIPAICNPEAVTHWKYLEELPPGNWEGREKVSKNLFKGQRVENIQSLVELAKSKRSVYMERGNFKYVRPAAFVVNWSAWELSKFSIYETERIEQ